MNRAYATLQIKAAAPAADGKRRFSGIATTPATDRMADIVEPKGAVFKLPLPLLWQHDSAQPIGWVNAAKVTDKGIEIEGEIASIDEEGSLKQRLTEAWQMLTSKLVRGLSIGFNPIEHSRIDGTYGLRFLKWEWLELSAVTIPANQEATILAIKSIDERQRAAFGRTLAKSNPPPGASGSPPQPAAGGFFNSRSQKGTAMKTIQELRAAREEKAARMGELMTMKSANDGSYDAAARQEFDDLSAEVEDIDDDIRVLNFHALNSRTAKAVDGTSADSASRSRSRVLPTKAAEPDEKFKGQNFVRGVIAKALAHLNGNGVRPSEIAVHRWGKSNPQLITWIKANEVAGGSSATGEWGAELVAMDGRYTGDFIDFLYGLTVFDRLPLRAVPANITIKGQDGAATGYWVGQSLAIPASAADFSSVNLTPLKVAALAVISNELIRDSSPSAEMLVRDSLGEASAQRVDTTFLSATAASAGVSPAGLLAGLSAGATNGSDADGLRHDIQDLYAGFISAKNATGLHFVTTPTLAKSIQLMRNALGQREFEGVMGNGGTLEGDPLWTGDNVGSGDLILLKPSDIYKIDDRGVQVSISREATIEQNSVPTGDTATPAGIATAFTSMFQSESTAIKVVRSINYAKRRSGAVAFIGNAAYSAGT